MEFGGGREGGFSVGKWWRRRGLNPWHQLNYQLIIFNLMFLYHLIFGFLNMWHSFRGPHSGTFYNNPTFLIFANSTYLDILFLNGVLKNVQIHRPILT